MRNPLAIGQLTTNHRAGDYAIRAASHTGRINTPSIAHPIQIRLRCGDALRSIG
jgi:hypothetical protein